MCCLPNAKDNDSWQSLPHTVAAVAVAALVFSFSWRSSCWKTDKKIFVLKLDFKALAQFEAAIH